MARTLSTICYGCRERAWRDYSYANGPNDKYEGRYIEDTTDDGKPVCNWCVESDLNYPNVVVVFDPDLEGVASVQVGQYVSMNSGDGYVGCEEIIGLFGRPTWHSTDPWRGYNEFTIPDGYVTVGGGGWYTGWASEDDHAYKMDLYALKEALEEYREALPCRVYALCCVTSNVFSQALDIVVAKGDKEAFCEWLSNYAFLTEDDLRGALS